MQITRVISIFDIKSEQLLEDINVDHIPFDTLKDVFINEKDNPSLIKPCIINEAQITMLNKFLSNGIVFNSNRVYQLDCFKNDA